MIDKTEFKSLLQVCVVVGDLEETVKNYWDNYGIGPWKIWTFDSSTVDDMVVRGERMDHAMRVALCDPSDAGGVEWEVVEPLDDKSIYADFLKEHGDGLHHVAFDVDNPDEFTENMKERGFDILAAGTWVEGKGSLRYIYFDTRDELGTISEIYKISEDFERPEPEETYGA